MANGTHANDVNKRLLNGCMINIWKCVVRGPTTKIIIKLDKFRKLFDQNVFDRLCIKKKVSRISGLFIQ